MDTEGADRITKNRWSVTAGVSGFGIAIFLLLAFDLPDTYLLRVLCAGPVLLGKLLGVFELGVSSFWNIAPFSIFGAFVNAAWYMIVVETIRLLLKKLSPR